MKPVWRVVYDAASAIAGDMTYPEEGWALYEAARRSSGFIVEVGSFKGLSTAMLLTGSNPGQVVICVDPHEGVKDTSASGIAVRPSTIEPFWNTVRLTGQEHRCVIVPARSDAAFDTVRQLTGDRAGLVFIDGSHLEEDAFFDFVMYSGLVPVGGFLICDDLAYSTVGRAWARWDGKADFAPVDLRTWGITDGVHKREWEGCLHKMTFMQRVTQ